jgi:hypothetical protein
MKKDSNYITKVMIDGNASASCLLNSQLIEKNVP